MFVEGAFSKSVPTLVVRLSRKRCFKFGTTATSGKRVTPKEEEGKGISEVLYHSTLRG